MEKKTVFTILVFVVVVSLGLVIAATDSFDDINMQGFNITNGTLLEATNLQGSLDCTNISSAASNLCTLTNTSYSAGNGIALASNAFTVAGNTALSQDSDGLSVTADAIGDTQLAFDTGQALTNTSAVKHLNLTVGGSLSGCISHNGSHLVLDGTAGC